MLRFAIALVLAGLVFSGSAEPQNSRRGEIRVSTRLVQVGVIARGKDGPVQGLTKDDFLVLDQGKPRDIQVFSVESGARVPEPPSALPENTFSDLPRYGANKPRSVTVVLLDNLNTLYGTASESKYEKSPYWMEDLALRNAQLHLIEFIKQLQPQDRVAIYGLRQTLHILCDFTSDREQLLAILKNYDSSSITNRRTVEPGNTMIEVGGHDRPADDIAAGAPMSSFENRGALVRAGNANADREAQTMAALRQISAHVADFPGRKSLVWLTANIPFSGAAMARVLSPANIAVYPIDARGLLPTSAMLLADIHGTADADDVSGASGHWDNMPGQSSEPIGIPNMEELAVETGGQAFVNTNDITGAIRKAVEDSAVTYTLGFYLDSFSMDGKFHKIKVQSKRNGVTLRYPTGYFAYSDAVAPEDRNQQALFAALESPLESSLIPLEMKVDRVNQPEANSLRLTCEIDVRGIRLAQQGGLRKGKLAVYTIEQDATGKVLQRWDKTFDLQLTEGQYAALLKTGMPFHQIVHLRDGTTTLRLLVDDPSTNNIGSLIIPIAEVK